MTRGMECQQVILGFAKNEGVAPGVLEDIAEAVANALDRDARFVAFGPIVSCDFERNAIDVEFTVAAETTEQADERVKRVRELIQSAIVACEYSTSSERIAVPA